MLLVGTLQRFFLAHNTLLLQSLIDELGKKSLSLFDIIGAVRLKGILKGVRILFPFRIAIGVNINFIHNRVKYVYRRPRSGLYFTIVRLRRRPAAIAYNLISRRYAPLRKIIGDDLHFGVRYPPCQRTHSAMPALGWLPN